MHTWSLGINDPYTLILAADARLVPPDYCNDHIWEISLGGIGDIPALTAFTTFGLRARLMRLFFRFGLGNQILTDPNDFPRAPHINQFYPNYVHLSFSPFSGIDVTCEFWVPNSQILTGRFTLSNNSVINRQIRVECAANLVPLIAGQGMILVEDHKTIYLSGKTEGLAPVLLIDRLSENSAGPYPTLFLQSDLLSGSVQSFTWALASSSETALSLEKAQAALNRSWDLEIARIELQNQQNMVEIETGNADWDAAFAFSQKAAFSLFFGASAKLPFPSFVENRLPDQGFSPRCDGMDYDHLWNGQSVLETYFLTTLLLPGAGHLAEGLVRNFVTTQDEEGNIDGKPGLAGQRGRFLAPPYWQAWHWRIFQSRQNPAFLSDIFPGLLKFYQTWFLPEHDRDGDGFPEWDHLFQSGFYENPIFDRWHPWGMGADISVVESPALGAFLFREMTDLTQIARTIKRESEVKPLQAAAGQLKKAVENTWDSRRHFYHYQDINSHSSFPGETLFTVLGSGTTQPKKTLKHPQRLIIEIQANDESATKPVSLTIHGASQGGSHQRNSQHV